MGYGDLNHYFEGMSRVYKFGFQKPKSKDQIVVKQVLNFFSLILVIRWKRINIILSFSKLILKNKLRQSKFDSIDSIKRKNNNNKIK